MAAISPQPRAGYDCPHGRRAGTGLEFFVGAGAFRAVPCASIDRTGEAMARVIGIDHLVIRVADFAKSKRFYNRVLGCLGFKLKYQYGRHAGWSNGKTLFWIGQADVEGRK